MVVHGNAPPSSPPLARRAAEVPALTSLGFVVPANLEGQLTEAELSILDNCNSNLRTLFNGLEMRRIAHEDVKKAQERFLRPAVFPPVEARAGDILTPSLFSRDQLSQLIEALDKAVLTDHLFDTKMGPMGDQFTDQLAAAKKVVSSGYPDGGFNSSTIWDQLAENIKNYDKGELAQNAAAMAKYMALYKDITDLISSLSDHISTKDDKYMAIKGKDLKDAMQAIVDKYKPIPSSEVVIAGKAPASGITEGEANAIAKKLGLPASSVVKNDDGTYCVIPDISEVEKLITDFPDGRWPTNGNEMVLTIAEYNVWKSGFDAQVNRIEDSLQKRNQKYSQANTSFLAFVNRCTAIIDMMTAMMMEMIKRFA
ncbi:IpaD/SipD/SspD family type III secretion system needle tip protein [Glaciimonas immobilis]|uniref:Translocator protein BipD n=1 Tax=Glaciimonas immobilis TaxID=728004 RepID=A0A840RQ18_9BURK|nr:IpaD/SipD/SspD family type III secretion system needle tip protein [Glaciimonas immobilis]KAF3999342.1 IpaD/SipD/SspD family type III secretion system needle tip protein [Glaciimonas immobilis]MBB5198824.1 type III secretion system IpaD/SipD/SspD family effector [Glaciimonas immobilis]